MDSSARQKLGPIVAAAMAENPHLNNQTLHIAQRILDFDLEAWGLVILRGTYASQAQWDKYLATFKRHVEEQLLQDVPNGDAAQTILDLHPWTVIEDPATMDDISFLEREMERSGKTRAPGAELYSLQEKSPRYLFFIYVDQDMLETLVDVDKATWESGNLYWLVYLHSAMKIESRLQRCEDAIARGEDLDESDQDFEDDYEEEFAKDAYKKCAMKNFVWDYKALNRAAWDRMSTNDWGIWSVAAHLQEHRPIKKRKASVGAADIMQDYYKEHPELKPKWMTEDEERAKQFRLF